MAELQLVTIENPMDFWGIITEIDDPRFMAQKNKLMNQYLQPKSQTPLKMYGLAMVNHREKYHDSMFCQINTLLLPCFCIKEKDTATFLWTHPRARNRGFSKKLVELLEIQFAKDSPPDAVEFWKKCNVSTMTC